MAGIHPEQWKGLYRPFILWAIETPDMFIAFCERGTPPRGRSFTTGQHILDSYDWDCNVCAPTELNMEQLAADVRAFRKI